MRPPGFIAIIARELRAASRRMSTYRIRILAVLAAIGFAIFNLWAITWIDFDPMSGRQLFETMVPVLHAFCLIIGMISTLECISEERREGTLGLLFLTTLKGRDVVLGKFAACGLSPAYGLFATLPVLALTLLLGGVTWSAFARTALALCTTLFFSLSVGMLFSALNRNRKGTGLIPALAVILAYGFGLSYLSEAVRLKCPMPELATLIDAASTRYLVEMALPRSAGFFTNYFWASWVAITSASLCFLCLAWRIVPRTWQEKSPTKNASRRRDLLRRWNYGAEPARCARRRRALDRNPVFWLAARELVGAPGLLLVIFAAGLVAIAAGTVRWWASPTGELASQVTVWFFAVNFLDLLLLGAVATRASCRIAADRLSGALELLASTPIKTTLILRGEIVALIRRFASPALCLFLLHGFVLWMTIEGNRAMLAHRGSFLELLWKSLVNSALNRAAFDFDHIIAGYTVIHLFLIPAAWIALGWTGLWSGMRARKAGHAPLAPIVLVIIVPLALWWFLLGLNDYLRIHHQWDLPSTNRFAFLLLAAVFLVNVLFSSLWTQWILRTRFRAMASRRFSSESDARKPDRTISGPHHHPLPKRAPAHPASAP